MTKKTKKADKALNRLNIPKQRRGYIDFDYADKIDSESRDWLNKFTLEYYGADFDINPTFIKNETGEFVQISKNDDKSKNLDLRKCRKLQKFYKTKDGSFTPEKRAKYSHENLHKNELMRKACNQLNNDISRDIMNVCHNMVENDDFNTILENLQESMSPEEMSILVETLCTEFEVDRDHLIEILKKGV